MKNFVILGGATATGLILAWFAGNLAPEGGSGRLLLRVGLAAIMLVAAAIVAWFLLQKKKGAAPALAPSAGNPGDELSLLLSEAEAKLAAARWKGGSRFSNLPAFFVVGNGGSAKTTALVQSGLEPELLAGQVYVNHKITPTPYANLWFAKQAIWVEAGAKLLGDSAAWARLVRQFQPGKLNSVVNQNGQAPRVIVACYDTEALLRQPLETNLTEARNLRTRFSELAQLLGLNLPVYVLFTRADRIAFFHEYVANLQNQEAAQILGVTLPRDTATKGVFGEQQTARLNEAYQQLFYSLADRRTDFLQREAALEKTPAIYEFPREFRKLRGALVPFLVELSRPNQLTVTPYLRGFYFSGVRPVIVQENLATPAAEAAMSSRTGDDPEATGIFKVNARAGVSPQAESGAGLPVRKVPQWVFLPKFFQDVLLQDPAAVGSGATNVRTNSLRRIVFGVAAGLSLLLAIGFLVSYMGNRRLEQTALAAANGIASQGSSSAALPSLDALARLETLRLSLAELTRNKREGTPFHLRWGLYAGSDLYPNVRQLYFSNFQQLLLRPVQQRWIASLKGLPPAPSPTNDYERTYNTLKGYLITTSNSDKSKQPFLAPLLGARWAEIGNPGTERMGLAQKQFSFYNEELQRDNPFSSENDALAVKRGRDYLKQFGGSKRVYQFMIAEANKANQPVNFNRQFQGSEEEVVNNRDVAGAFTKGGWNTMQDAIKNVDRYFNGEQWVLGDAGAGKDIDRANLDADIRKFYYTDFIREWREYLRRSVVVPYKDPKDAVKKLSATASAQSPLLELFSLASQNTDVDAPEVKKAMHPLHTVMPPSNGDQFVGASNTEYVRELATLQNSLEQFVGAGSTSTEAVASAAQTLKAANEARLLTAKMALSFGADPDGGTDRTIRKLMEDPITQVEALLRGLGPAELNGKGKELCAQMRQLISKYPFNPNASTQATLPEVNAIFQPKEGTIWKFYDANLDKKYLKREGGKYVAVPGGEVQVTAAYINFLNRAAAFSDALYPGGATEPRLTFTLKPIKTEGVEITSFEIDGQAVTYSSSTTPAAKQFTWPGATHGVKIETLQGTLRHAGLWSVFQFFWRADHWSTVGSVTTLERILRAGDDVLTNPNETPRMLRFELDMGTNPPIFKKGYLSSIGCVAEVAK